MALDQRVEIAVAEQLEGKEFVLCAGALMGATRYELLLENDARTGFR